MKKSAILFSFLSLSCGAFAQGTFSGDLMMNANFFMKDTSIKASGNPLYDNALSGSEGWLTVRYSHTNGLSAYVRADAFNNSNLQNPVAANTDFGIGAWNITKEFTDLSVSAGSIYDQIGSGILFRSYEDRGLFIDNALMGIELKYRLSNNISLKAFTGQQKNNTVQNDAVNNKRFGPVIKGFNAEGDYSVGKVHMNPGIGILNRTLDENSMKAVAATINLQPLPRFEPKYNMYAFTAYNTLTYKNFSWYAEGAYKTHEAILSTDLYGSNVNTLIDRDGNIEYTTLSYGKKGIALNLSGKRSENFVMRTSPNELALKGMLNWQPVVAVLRPLRLMSRYSPPSEAESEMAGTANVVISPNDVTTFNATYTHINDLHGNELFREAYADATYVGLKSWTLECGVQYLEYNILIYQSKSAASIAPIVYAITPFAEITYKFTDRKSLRCEVQYMNTKQDYGSWAFALIEYNVAPKWSISISDMYNINPNKGTDNPNYNGKSNHYYNLYTAYTKGPHRFSLAYVKQVDGMNCTGGVCRYEPAFSGIKGTITSSF